MAEYFKHAQAVVTIFNCININIKTYTEMVIPFCYETKIHSSLNCKFNIAIVGCLQFILQKVLIFIKLSVKLDI